MYHNITDKDREALAIMQIAGHVMEEVDPGEYDRWQKIAGKPL